MREIKAGVAKPLWVLYAIRRMKVVSVVGARPQFVKAAALCPALRARVSEALIHTGQHYDYEMSQIFFEQLRLPSPDYHLGVGSGTHGKQTGEILQRIEPILTSVRPDWVLVYGDTNSTLAAGLAAAKLAIPVAHVEAGMRSFVRTMPEEINRVLTDHLSKLLLCPTDTAVTNLAREGITDGVHQVGDLMAELLTAMLPRAQQLATAERLGLEPQAYVFATIHRAANTDTPEALQGILAGLAQSPDPVLLPLHPRTRAALERFHLQLPPPVRAIDPVGYFEALSLQSQARLIVTDSGGVQKEAYLVGVPCLTLRDETEWPETVTTGWNTLVGAQPEAIAAGLRARRPSGPRPALFGTGSAAQRIAALVATGQ